MHRLVLLISLLVLATACVCITAGVAAAESLPKKAVFEGTTDEEFNDFGIWLSNLDGSEPERIADHHSYNPVLSPDGLEVAFMRHENKKAGNTCLEVMAVEGDLEGQHTSKVYCVGPFATGPQGVTWAPNGYELAFSDQTKEDTGIYVLNLKTKELNLVADWYAWQEAPSFSPDGSQIAFRTTFNPQEELEAGIWIVDSDGTDLHQLTNEWEDEPSWSPDGTQIAVAAFNEEEINEDEGGVALLNSTTGAYEEWLLDEDGYYEWDPEWTPDGKEITYSRYIEEGIFETEPERIVIGAITTDGTEEQDPLNSEFFWNENFKAQQVRAGLEIDPTDLLERYEPRLHYNKMEQYFADSAAEATDGPENRILDSTKETILAAHEVPYVTPSLSLFSEPKFAENAVNGWIDEGPEYAEDAAEMHAKEEYAHRAYGRVYQDPETDVYWLDYWFYYYYDGQEFAEVGVHESDWEHIALRLDSEGIPDLAVYSRHGGETAACEASAVEWENSDLNTLSPNAYIANASHANYFEAGEYNRPFPKPTDQANGDGAIATPLVSQVESAASGSETALPRWLYWSGRWGNSNDPEFESPESPAREGSEWNDLLAWAESHEENCDVERGERSAQSQERAQARQLARPPAPELTARASGNDEITIRYDVPESDPPARFILLSVSARNEPDATRSKSMKLKANHGVVRVPRPFAAGPYEAAAITFSARREPSKASAAPVVP